MGDSRDSLIVLLKEKYEHENRRRSYFDGALGTPITLLTTLVGGVYFAINDTSGTNTVMLILKYVLIISLAISCNIAFYFLYRVYFQYNDLYSSFPDSKSVKGYFESLKLHFKNCAVENIEEAVDNELKDQTIQWYVDSNTCNTQINDKRGDAFYKSRAILGITLAIGIALFLLICLNKSLSMSDKDKKPTQQPAPKEKALPKPPPIRQERAQQPDKKLK